jgi:hypothetical protein
VSQYRVEGIAGMFNGGNMTIWFCSEDESGRASDHAVLTRVVVVRPPVPPPAVAPLEPRAGQQSPATAPPAPRKSELDSAECA